MTLITGRQSARERYEEISNDPEPPPEIKALNLPWVGGSYWLNPQKPCRPVEEEMRRHCWHHLAEFIREYQVRPFKPSSFTLMKFLASGGASRELVDHVAKSYFDKSGYHWNTAGSGSVFDHVEFWGKDRVPLFMIGHPYNHISSGGMMTLSALGELGLGCEIMVPSLSWYGFGTLHVRVGRCLYAGSVAGRQGGGGGEILARGEHHEH